MTPISDHADNYYYLRKQKQDIYYLFTADPQLPKKFSHIDLGQQFKSKTQAEAKPIQRLSFRQYTQQLNNYELSGTKDSRYNQGNQFWAI